MGIKNRGKISITKKNSKKVFKELFPLGCSLTCKRCKHKWSYKGKSKYYATCPCCYNKVRILMKGGNE